MNHEGEFPFISKGHFFLVSKEISKSAGLGHLESLTEEEQHTFR